MLCSFSWAIFSSKLYLKLLSKLETQQTFNVITSHLPVNSNILALKPIKRIPLVRCQTLKTIEFLKLEPELIKFKLSFSPWPQYSIMLATFSFQSFIILIRVERGFRKVLKKYQNFEKVSLIHRTNFFTKILLVPPLSQHKIKKQNISLCQPGETKY